MPTTKFVLHWLHTFVCDFFRMYMLYELYFLQDLPKLKDEDGEALNDIPDSRQFHIWSSDVDLETNSSNENKEANMVSKDPDDDEGNIGAYIAY